MQLRKEVRGDIHSPGTAAVVAVVHLHPMVNLSSHLTELVQLTVDQHSTDQLELLDLAVVTEPQVLPPDQRVVTTDLHLQPQDL